MHSIINDKMPFVISNLYYKRAKIDYHFIRVSPVQLQTVACEYLELLFV